MIWTLRGVVGGEMAGVRICLALLLVAASGWAWADEVHLRSGGLIRGIVVAESGEAVVVETGPGRVSIPRSHVTGIERAETALAAFYERWATLPPNDVEGLVRLARFAAEHDLATPAREAWRRVLALDPAHPEANAALGRIFLDGQWMSESEAYRSQGYVRVGDRWMTPGEHEALVREEVAREQAALERREARVRLREAEARAREAEARAREAEARADQAEAPVEGIPYWWVLAGGGPIWWPGTPYPGPPALGPGHTGHPRPPLSPHGARRPGPSRSPAPATTGIRRDPRPRTGSTGTLGPRQAPIRGVISRD
jgi:hypothetical protein